MNKLMKLFVALGLAISLVGCTKEEPKKEEPATVGTTLVAAFKEEAKKGQTSEEIANALLENEICDFAGMAMPVEPGLLTGFDNAEIEGFKEGTMFAPMIGSMPFVGYVFTLDEGVDATAFMKTLKDNANTRWNICTEAKETVCENVDDQVVFIMCPTSFEED